MGKKRTKSQKKKAISKKKPEVRAESKTADEVKDKAEDKTEVNTDDETEDKTDDKTKVNTNDETDDKTENKVTDKGKGKAVEINVPDISDNPFAPLFKVTDHRGQYTSTVIAALRMVITTEDHKTGTARTSFLPPAIPLTLAVITLHQPRIWP